MKITVPAAAIQPGAALYDLATFAVISGATVRTLPDSRREYTITAYREVRYTDHVLPILGSGGRVEGMPLWLLFDDASTLDTVVPEEVSSVDVTWRTWAAWVQVPVDESSTKALIPLSDGAGYLPPNVAQAVAAPGIAVLDRLDLDLEKAQPEWSPEIPA